MSDAGISGFTNHTMSPEASTVRDRIDAMNSQQIEIRRNEILAIAQGDYEKLQTPELHELAYIASKLRRTNVGPPKESKAKKATPKDIGDLI